MRWQHRLDDLNKNDRITVDEGNMLVTGFYKGIARRETSDGVKWFIKLADKGEQKWCWTVMIEDLKVVRRAGPNATN